MTATSKSELLGCTSLTPLDLPLSRFEEIWFHDFEFIPAPGELPEIVCLVAHELRTGRTLRLWADELSERPPYRTDDRVLFINFAATAEMICHHALGWPIPRNILDLSPVFRNLTNGRATPEGKGLVGMLRYFDLDTIGAKRKDAMRDRILQGPPFKTAERIAILDYCASDVMALAELLPRVLPLIGLDIALHWGEFAGVSATMERNGVPLDPEYQPRLADPETWRRLKDDMVPKIDAAYGVYVDDGKGGWSFSMERFAAYNAREGIIWPTLVNAKGEIIPDMRRKTFEAMAKAFPQLEPLRQLRYARDKMRRIKLAVGADHRNRTTLWPFQSKTGRTQPKASLWIFSPSVWLRSLIKPGPGMAISYIDYSSMEFLLAAAFSDGHTGPRNPMLDMYRSGDPYLAFAKRVGAVPQTATKTSHEEIRERYKVMLLSTQYGLAAASLAIRLKISEFEAQEMLDQHRHQFSQYWAWSDDYIQNAMQTGVVRTALGWTYHIGIVGAVNERSLRNWPIQSAGADILRVACIWAARCGIKLLGSVHDAILIEAPIDRIDADVALMREIMRRASRVVLNATAEGTHELRTDFKTVCYPDRYSDKRGVEIWDHATELLKTAEDGKGEENDQRSTA